MHTLHQHRRRVAELVDTRTAELAAARDRAEAANSAKTIFLANMSHELRNPLSSILGITGLLRDEVTSGEHREYLEMIDRSGEQLLTIINDVLDMAKIEAGKQELVPVAVDVVALARDLTEMMHVKVADKNLDLSCICARDVRRFVRLDAAKLRQVLMNLLGNALKFTDSGRGYASADFRARGPIGPDTPAIRGGRHGQGNCAGGSGKNLPTVHTGWQADGAERNRPRTRDYKAVRGAHGGHDYRQERAWSGLAILRGGPG